MRLPTLRAWATTGMVVCVGALLACSTTDETAPPGAAGGGGGAVEACPAGEAPLAGGGCRPAGVPPSACAQGFEPDGRAGCVAVLPAQPCADGQLALPGEDACHELAPCGDPPWGDIPVEADTVYVDASYSGGASDGSAARPFVTVQQGIDTAPSHAIVAVAAGSYPEDLYVQGKPVRLWGRCPALVEIAGQVSTWAALLIGDGADGSEVRNLGLTGVCAGFTVSGAVDVLGEGLWMYDTACPGVAFSSQVGPTSVTVRGSLVERAATMGFYVEGASAVVESTVVRDTLPAPGGVAASGIQFVSAMGSLARPSNVVRGCLVERTPGQGVAVYGADLRLEGSLVRDSFGRALDGIGGYGLDVIETPIGVAGSVTMTGSVLDRNVYAGARIIGAQAVLEGSVVRNTQSDVDQLFGRGIAVQADPETAVRGTAVIRSTLIEGNRDVGLFFAGADAVVDGALIRDTLPELGTETGGRGVGVQEMPPVSQWSDVRLVHSVVEDNHEIGVFVHHSRALIEDTVVRATKPTVADQRIGRGIEVDGLSTATIRRVLVEDSHDAGVFVSRSTLLLEASTIRGTLPSPGADGFGDGMSIFADIEPAIVTVRGTRIETSARVGIGNFGASVLLANSVLECNLIHLNGEPIAPGYAFEDAGGNACGCSSAEELCQVMSANLEVPQPVDELDR